MTFVLKGPGFKSFEDATFPKVSVLSVCQFCKVLPKQCLPVEIKPNITLSQTYTNLLYSLTFLNTVWHLNKLSGTFPYISC